VNLGAGESEAIRLALELHPDRVIVDEKAARRIARALGLNVVGLSDSSSPPNAEA
jgi:predicted nucleic acid-binding protein